FAASEGADAVRLVNGVVVPVRYRTSFMSRLIQSEPPIQDYYTAVKNYLLSFKGVKARTSWNFESFNKGRIQCAKLNVKGSAFQVYLGLDPSEYSEDKYHFVNVGDKPKLDKVPLMMKVKSDRSLKYTFELIDEVMSKNGIERGDLPEVDYHMPYESTEALVDKDLVKVILPDGMQIDENTIIEKVNVGELLKDVKPAEEAVVEAPVVEEPVVEEPVVEAPAPIQIVDHHVAEEQITFVDAVEADEIISDEQANELIETVARDVALKPKTNKCYEINLDTICEAFEDGEIVDLKALKARGIIAKKAERVKVLARGTMTKKVTVVADKFSIQAVKMIGLAGGLAQKYKD
ncbi:MAG: uL15 family ribosomal protein, partial [Clostridia bacterium]|nr:uL15 family ribosomal protein [Clostridia bacterium]